MNAIKSGLGLALAFVGVGWLLAGSGAVVSARHASAMLEQLRDDEVKTATADGDKQVAEAQEAHDKTQKRFQDRLAKLQDELGALDPSSPRRARLTDQIAGVQADMKQELADADAELARAKKDRADGIAAADKPPAGEEAPSAGKATIATLLGLALAGGGLFLFVTAPAPAPIPEREPSGQARVVDDADDDDEVTPAGEPEAPTESGPAVKPAG